MAYTRHGHHIQGTPEDWPSEQELRVARCGGPGLCPECIQDVTAFVEYNNIAIANMSQAAHNQVESMKTEDVLEVQTLNDRVVTFLNEQQNKLLDRVRAGELTYEEALASLGMKPVDIPDDLLDDMDGEDPVTDPAEHLIGTLGRDDDE